ncbi:MAG: right-handed parallel beta-helix repeat-containing protein [Waterburya sp.]
MDNRIINVDQDFDGDLDKAISAANDGDTVALGKKTYTTSGLEINKDITIDGFRGESIISGNNTSESIITINVDGGGSTIQDVEITNGASGINVLNASDVTLANLEIHNIGIEKVDRSGVDNFGINLSVADGFKVLDSEIYDIGRKGIGVIDADGGLIEGVTLKDINIDANHAQSYDAGGIKLFNTNDVTVKDNKMSKINAFNIWDDLTSNTVLDGNEITGAGDSFKAPDFNGNVSVAGIYVEKTYNTFADNNKVTSVDDRRPNAGVFLAFDSTEFSSESLVLGENNDFSSQKLDTTDYWANESAEKRIATTEDPLEANFSLVADDYFNGDTFGGDNGDGEASL